MNTLKKTLCLVLMLSLVFALMAPGFAFAETKTDTMEDEESIEISADGIAGLLTLMAENDELCEDNVDKMANGWLINAEMLYILASVYDADDMYADDIAIIYGDMNEALEQEGVESEDISLACSAACVSFLMYIVTELDTDEEAADSVSELYDDLSEVYADEDSDYDLIIASHSNAMCTLLCYTAALLDEAGDDTMTILAIMDSLQELDEETEDSIDKQASDLSHSFLTECVIISLFDDAEEEDESTLDLETEVNDSNDDDADSDDVSDMQELVADELYLSATMLGAWAACVVGE